MENTNDKSNPIEKQAAVVIEDTAKKQALHHNYSVPSENDIVSENIITGEIQFDVSQYEQVYVSSTTFSEVEQKLIEVNKQLDDFTNHADKEDYVFAIASGIVAGIVDSLYTGEFSLTEAHKWGSDKTEEFVLKVANNKNKNRVYTRDDLDEAITYLAERASHGDATVKKGYHLASDSNMKDFGWTKQHHLRDFAHHASITGLVFSILTQFTQKCYGTDTSGAFIVVPVADTTFIGKDVPQKLLFGIVYWFFHLVSDMAGSGDLTSEGTGIPGPLLSSAKLLASTPIFKNKINDQGNREFSVFVSKLFNGTYFGERDENGKLIPLRFDFRTEIGILRYVGKQSLPVILNEVCVRAFYMIRRFVTEVIDKRITCFDDIKLINWAIVKPAGNRTIDRMLTVATLTFSVADTADAAVRAAIESGGNWIIFTGKFATKINYVGAARLALSVVKEISNEEKEYQLLREKRILTEAKTVEAISILETYKAELEETVSNYLAQDISIFLEGFDYMDSGLINNDSNLVIKGNVIIQKVLGREPQFTNQQEFDELMESDEPLKL